MSAVTNNIAVDSTPVVLFQDGWASLQIAVILLANPSADRAANPSHWVRWRAASDGTYDLQLPSGWLNAGRTECDPLPLGTRIAATFSQGASSTTISGSGQVSAVVRQTTLEFRASGEFLSGRFASGASGSTAVTSIPPSQRGTYHIDGYRLTLRLADGNTELHTLVNAYDTKWILIDGRSFMR